MASSPVRTLAFQTTLRRVGSAARLAVSQLWEDTDDWEELRDEYPNVLTPYAAAAGVLAEQWYHDLAPRKSFEIRAGSLPVVDALRGSVGWSFSQSDPLSALQGASERHVFTTARDTVVSNARREGVKFYRYASPDACDWCQMLAGDSRYLSEEAAISGHDRCNCVAVPDR